MIRQEEPKIKYFLYARKSSESEDRQIQSIDDQVNRLKELSRNLNLELVDVYTESKSAKKPNNRPLFDKMIERIENKEADGILCWQINRLTRNPIDGGKLAWLLQQGILKSIQTIDRRYLPEDNVLIFAVETGSANQFILDLSKNVKRGIQRKLNDGWRPGPPPQGYMNDLATHTIIKDPDRFDLIRKMWDLMLTESYTPPKILEIANNKWGFRTRKLKRLGGKELSKSGIYKIFTNLFYAGIIEHKGQQYPGKHEPMITPEEYDKVQIILGRKGKPRPQKHHFAFTGFIRCGECGCLYTAETKTKIIKNTGELKKYTYYHCTRRKKEINCSQRKSIKEEDLELQIEKELEKYTILPEFRDWALEILNKRNDKEIKDRTKIKESQDKALIQTQKELDNLTQMRYREMIDDEAFMKNKAVIEAKITEIKATRGEIENRAEKWLELTEKTFNFATYARQAFITGTLERKREILMSLGQNAIIKEGKLVIKPYEWLKPIAKNYPSLEKEYLALEPTKIPLNKAKTEALTSVRARWQGRQDSNLELFFWREEVCH